MNWFKFYINKAYVSFISSLNFAFKFIVLLSITIVGAGFSQQKVMTNVELLASVAEDLASTGVARLKLSRGAKIFLLERGEKTAVTHFVVDQFCHGLMKQGVKIFTVDTDTSADKGVLLSLIVSRASVWYPKIYRKGFFGKAFLEREAEVNLSLRAVDEKSRKILWAGNLTGNKRNRIPLSELEFVEQKGFLLGRPDRPVEKGIRRWIEPIFVGGITAVIVYLFYSVRSR